MRKTTALICYSNSFEMFPSALEMLLPETKLNLLATRIQRRLLNLPSSSRRSTKIDTNIGNITILLLLLEFKVIMSIQIGHISPINDSVPQSTKQPPEIRPPKVGPTAQFGEWIAVLSDTVEDNVVCCVKVDLFGKVRVDTQKVLAISERLLETLGLEAVEQRLEPGKVVWVTADPDELDSLEFVRHHPLRLRAEMPKLLQH